MASEFDSIRKRRKQSEERIGHIMSEYASLAPSGKVRQGENSEFASVRNRKAAEPIQVTQAPSLQQQVGNIQNILPTFNQPNAVPQKTTLPTFQEQVGNIQNMVGNAPVTNWLYEQAQRRAEAPGLLGKINRLVEPVSHAIDVAQTKIPGLGAFQQGAAQAAGVPNFGPPVTGSKLVNAPANLIGQVAGLATVPSGGLGQNALTAPMQAGQKFAANVSNPLARTAVRGATEGMLGGALGSATSGQTDAKDLSNNILLGGALGVGGEALGAGAGALGRAAGKYIRNIAEEITGNSLKYQQLVDEIGEQGAKADIGKKNLADIDEQLDAIKGTNSPTKGQELDALMNERDEVIKFIKQNDPEFVAPTVETPNFAENPNTFAPNVGQPKPVVEPAKPIEPVTPLSNVSRTGENTPGIRRNFKTQVESDQFSPELNKQINEVDQTYEPQSNITTVERSRQLMEDPANAESLFLNNKILNSGDNAVHTQLGYDLMKFYDNHAQYAKAIEISEKLAKDLTKQGQGVQAASIIKRLSPEGQLMALTRRAESNGMKVSPQDRQAFREAAESAQASANPVMKNNAVQDVLDKLEIGAQPTPDDLKLLQRTLERARKYESKNIAKETVKETKTSKREAILNSFQKAEDEAWERIRKRRGVGITPGAGNEIVDYAIIAANKVVKGTLKLTENNHVKQLVAEFGEKVRPIATKIYKKTLGQIAKHPELNAIKKTLPTAEELVEKYAAGTATSTEDLSKIRELAKAVSKLEGAEGRKAQIQMQQIMNKYRKASVLDKFQAVRFMAMLGNTLTQGINISSNLAMALFHNVADLFGSMVDALVSPILKRNRTTAAIGMPVWEYIPELVKNFKEGAVSNWKGVTPGGLTSLDELSTPAFQKRNNPKALGKTLNVAETPLRISERILKTVMGGADYSIYKTEFNNELRKQAKLAAKREGKTGDDKFIRDFLTDPPPQVIEIADRIGRSTTFQQKGGVGDAVTSALASLGGKGIAGKAVEQGVRAAVPFIRTPLNIASTAVNLTPVGFIKGVIGLTSKNPQSQRQAIRNIVLSGAGGGLTALGSYLNDIGIITAGNESGDKELDAIREQSGKGKYRFNQSALVRYLGAILGGEGKEAAEEAAKYQEGDRSFDYNRLQPIAFPLAAGAGLNEGGVTKGLQDAAGSLVGMTALKGIQDIAATPQQGTEGEKQTGFAKRFVESYLKSFSPSLLAQEARREDTTQRKTPYNKSILKDVGGYYQSRIPSLGGLIPEEYSSKGLPASMTTLGQPKKQTPGIAGQYLNPYRSDVQAFSKAAKIISDLIDRTGTESLAPKAPSNKISGKDRKTRQQVTIEIPPKRYEQYQADIGNEITRKILELSPSLSDQLKVKRIENIMKDTKEKYSNRLKREMGIVVQ